ncbi:MAG: dipeptidase PepE [Flavobacteriales bacterium]|nr:dipeptidase PepE [Flavobacteriales bacterium]
MELLLLSNSTLPGEAYFAWPKPHVQPFLTGKRRIAFVPFAAVDEQQDAYVERMSDLFGEWNCETIGLHRESDPVKTLSTCDAVAIGGGNSFLLIRSLYRSGLMRALQPLVKEGMPYLGWSAGSNVACPTIMTTNDMPIVEAPSLKALNLIPFQINPHFTEATIAGHGGESRSQRIAEYLAMHPHMPVVGLREGSLLHVHKDQMELIGKDMTIFRRGSEPEVITAGTKLRIDLRPLAPAH